MKRKVPQSVGAAYHLIEQEMLKGPWVMGDTYTICDPYLFTMSEWLEGDGVNLSRLPKVIDHRNRMSERPAVRKAIAQERDHLDRGVVVEALGLSSTSSGGSAPSKWR